MIQFAKILLTMMVGITVVTESVHAQEEGKLTGRRPFEELENRLFSKYLAEEEFAILMLEKEMAYRKVRYEMLKLGAKNRGISLTYEVEKNFPILIFEENDHDQARHDALEWRVFLRNETDHFLKKLQATAIELGQAKLKLLSVQLERLGFEQRLLEEQRDQKIILYSRSPTNQDWANEQVRKVDDSIRDRKSQSEEMKAKFERISKMSIDLSYLIDEVSRIIRE